MSAPALFLDRDGTLVQPRHYPTRPEELLVFEGVPDLLHDFQVAGWRIVIVTNQSGVARGYLTEGELLYMHSMLAADMARHGVRLDEIYYCPHHPAGTVRPFNVECSCRKPRPGMLLRAARELDIDLAHSWFVGDILDDIEAGHRAGCRAVLVDLGTEALPTTSLRTPEAVGRSTVHALRIIAEIEGIGLPVERDYRPARWELEMHELGRGRRPAQRSER